MLIVFLVLIFSFSLCACGEITFAPDELEKVKEYITNYDHYSIRTRLGETSESPNYSFVQYKVTPDCIMFTGSEGREVYIVKNGGEPYQITKLTGGSLKAATDQTFESYITQFVLYFTDYEWKYDEAEKLYHSDETRSTIKIENNIVSINDFFVTYEFFDFGSTKVSISRV